MLNRIAAAANSDTAVEVGVRAILDICKEVCGVSYNIELEEFLRADERSLREWLERSGTEYSADARWTARSWLLGIQTIPLDDGLCTLQLELEGHQSSEWDEITCDETIWSPETCGVGLLSVNALYSANNEENGLDWKSQNCAEYTLCLGVAAVLVRTVIRQCPTIWQTSQRVYICWAGGDYIELRV